jgi:hypothetical protein
MRENDGGCRSKIYHKHICKYHSVSSCTTIYANKINLKSVCVRQVFFFVIVVPKYLPQLT